MVSRETRTHSRARDGCHVLTFLESRHDTVNGATDLFSRMSAQLKCPHAQLIPALNQTNQSRTWPASLAPGRPARQMTSTQVRIRRPRRGPGHCARRLAAPAQASRGSAQDNSGQPSSASVQPSPTTNVSPLRTLAAFGHFHYRPWVPTASRRNQQLIQTYGGQFRRP